MSLNKRKLLGLDRWAISLVALLVLAPLTAHLIGQRMRHFWVHSDLHVLQDPSVIIGVLTLGILIFQARIFQKQALIADGQRKLMKKQANISRNQAVLENRRFVAENRPRLTVRQLSNGLHYVDENASSGLGWQSNSFFTTFSITNTGGTECKILESRAELLAMPKVLNPMQFARLPNSFLDNMNLSAGHVESRMVFCPVSWEKASVASNHRSSSDLLLLTTSPCAGQFFMPTKMATSAALLFGANTTGSAMVFVNPKTRT